MIKQNVLYGTPGSDLVERLGTNSLRFPRRTVIALILLVALMAFEIFNFDTTRYALSNLLGPVSFLGMRWAAILAIAFCAIDFAGLVRMFTPESGGEQPKEVWYLMGAWLLGATMNAIMTWWAVSLTLLNHDFGNEVLSRGQLLQFVPIFVATLVWLTRILFIGALTVTGNQLLFTGSDEELGQEKSARRRNRQRTSLAASLGRPVQGAVSGARPTLVSRHGLPHVSDEVPEFLNRRARPEESDLFDRSARQAEAMAVARKERPAAPVRNGEDISDEERAPKHVRTNGRVKQRPPMPGTNGFQARSRGRN